MITKLETVTPEQARAWLEKNEGNRGIRESWVNALAGMIQRGQWAETHQGIAFATGGRLIDGQHRLHAIVRAGKPVRILVTRGLDEEVYVHIDGGKSRTLQDRLKLIGDSTAANTYAVSITRNYYVCTIGRGKAMGTLTVDALENLFLTMPDEITKVALMFSRHRIRSVTTAAVGAGCSQYLRFHPKAGEEFLEQLVTGTEIESGSGPHLLRDALLSGRITNHELESYWKTISATQMHHADRRSTRLFVATTDWAGNHYQKEIDRIQRRNELGAKSQKKRWAEKKKAAEA